ncbi:MAG: metalloregulator ArsR/SmtB family transcription factor [Bacteroidales bacterium]|jgi:DNA-binding transcriptional ArsR family regulator|nr:metalloregulator ArsR/SmtB family transcription factor [Bacteroidales bacterium]MCK9448657.1 metalloregulator ArsR/SmtB family transcription factor [Bacteroidales bacterium]MDD3702194.1 metalloregulator ArsR/SmtB family transcription factor [Bacteroidales bacterium]MDY0368932.1 metalloregulator ArsR/SmtB family transcription factor [Bacteroidales bacterium]
MEPIQIDAVKLEQLASKLKALAHPTRIAIIEMLSGVERMSVTEIYLRLDIEQASASHHLNILKNKGVLVSKREGKRIFYTLENESLAEIIKCIGRS